MKKYNLSVGLLLLVAALPVLSMLTSCATFDPDGSQSAGAGQAVYRYRHTADGTCEVTITSARPVSGLDAEVTEKCAVRVKSEELSGEDIQLKQLQLLERFIP